MNHSFRTSSNSFGRAIRLAVSCVLVVLCATFVFWSSSASSNMTSAPHVALTQGTHLGRDSLGQNGTQAFSAIANFDSFNNILAPIPTGTITANPNPIQVCDDTGLGVTTLSWTSSGTSEVEVRVGSPTGALFAHTISNGTGTTGKWVSNGIVFYLQNVSGGLPLTAANTLATVTVGVTCGVLVVGNFGFETPSVAAGSFQYNPAGGSWTFAGSGGVTANGSGFTSGNAGAPEGAQVAFLQAGGSVISQSISGFQSATSYTVTFAAAQRANCCNAGGQDFDVYLDDTLLATFHPTSTSYADYSTPFSPAIAGAHTLKFVGRNSLGGDHSAFIDNVRVIANGPGPVAYWKFDEGSGTLAANSSGTTLSGTLVNGPTWAAGKLNGAVSFDGANDYVQIGAQSTLVMSHTMTISAWIYPTGAGIIVNKEGEYEVERFGNGTIGWAFANSNPGWAWINTGYVVPVNQWTHLAVVYDKGVVRTYGNGAPVHTYNGTGAIGDAHPEWNDFRIGSRQCSVCVEYFQGKLDEVHLYNRALSAVEVQGLANDGNAAPTPTPTPTPTPAPLTAPGNVKEYIYAGGRLIATEETAGNSGAAPAAPSGLIATAASTTQINLSWTDNSNNETGFKIERSTDGGATFSSLATVGVNITSYSNTGLSPATPYHYRVKATNGVGDSAPSNTAGATTLNNPPAAPSNLSATAASTTQINLSWTDNSNNETGFKIERSTDGGATFLSLATVAVNITSYSNTGLSPATPYHYRVKATNGVGDSAPSNTASATTLNNPPAAPGNLSATAASTTQINLSWTDNSNNETGFKIERSTDGGATFLSLATVAVNITSYSNTGLSPATPYHYRVKATNGVGDSAPSNTASATTLNNPPAAPSNLSATAASTTQINLSWTDNSNNETGFKIERSTDGGATFLSLATVAVNITSYSNTGLSPATPYHYRVKATNASGDSAPSNTASATTLNNPPAAPSNLSATAASTTQINLSWTDNSNNETGFKIERSTDGGATFLSLATVGVNITSYSNTGLSPATPYHYRVKATNGVGDSAPSNTAGATTLNNPPAAPSNLSATADSISQITLRWTDNSNNETGFKIERSTDNTSFSLVFTTPANVTTYPNSGLTADTLYYYRVRATNGSGDSAASNTASARTLQPCNYALAPAANLSVPPSGITGAGVTVTANCAWTAVSNASWIVITAGSSGNGNGTVTYSVLANPGTAARTGAMTIAGLTFYVSQDACAYSIQPTNRAFSYTSDQDTVMVSAQGGCPWTAVSNASWITINSGGTGSGSNSVLYSVTANTSTTWPVSRTGTMTIAGQTFTVTQAGQPSCANAAGLSCDSLGFTGCSTKCFLSNGGSATVYVWLSRSDCNWFPVSDSAWIHITNVTDNGTNPRKVTYTVDANPSGPSRVGAVIINGLTHRVTEAGTSSAAAGRVTTSSGQGLAGVTMTFTALIPYPGLPAAVVTDANGYWSQSGFVACKSNIVTPGKSGYTFTPSKRGFNLGATNLDFVATQPLGQTKPSRNQPAADEATAQASEHDRRSRGEAIAGERTSWSRRRIVRSATSAGVGVLSCLALVFAIRRYRIRLSQGKPPPA